MSTSKNDLYTRAGITDLAEFYRTKFVSDEVLDTRYFKPLDRFDIRFARTMWVYDNVRAGSTVLDLGCGAGMLALLKRKKVTLTGVDLSAECSLAARRNGYDATFTAKLSRLPFPDASFDYVVSLDVLGHVGCEEKDQVLAEIKRVLRPGGLKFETDFVDYLRSLSFKERRAFDMAMGYVFGKISDLNIRLPTSGLYVFLKASDAPLGSFYNEHRDRRALYARYRTASGSDRPFGGACLDRSPAVTFDDGWYEPNLLPPIARWMSRSGKISFDSSQVSEITLDLTTHLPDLRTQPLELEFLLNGERLSCFAPLRRGWLNLHLFVPEGLNSEANGQFELEIRANRTWQSRPMNDETRDDRELSIAVCNMEVRGQRSEIGGRRLEVGDQRSEVIL